jgi:DNA-binding CsgD family transcriptional regulator
MLADAKLLKLNRDATLLDLGFARNAQWLLGPLVEAFCLLYEHEGNREAHDALLTQAINSMTSLDHSLPLAIRAARLGAAEQLPRLSMLMSRQCAVPSSLLRAYQDLFDSFISMRRQLPERARELAVRAAREFEMSGRPLMEALALEAAGSLEKAQAIRRAGGARIDAMRLKWSGTPIAKRLATNLTAREIEVARFVADGQTNREIAVALSLSERTIHRHCESIFGKLGIRSRWQIRAAISPIP